MSLSRSLVKDAKACGWVSAFLNRFRKIQDAWMACDALPVRYECAGAWVPVYVWCPNEAYEAQSSREVAS